MTSGRAPVITDANRALLAKSQNARCDKADGVEDGVLTDPGSCDFEPEALLCSTSSADGCLSPDQLKAVESVYEGPTVGGRNVFPGFPLGGEADPGGWDTWITGAENQFGPANPSLHFAFGTQMYKYLIFNDPNWDYSTYDFGRWEADIGRAAKILNATDPDLSPFRTAGGKLILWHGWSDPALTANATVQYYSDVLAGDPEATDYARLFMLPGVLHCAGGPGPDRVDWIDAITGWVEDGEAPSRLVATKRDQTGQAETSRPVCAYPKKAAYDGIGDPNAAASFTCK